MRHPGPRPQRRRPLKSSIRLFSFLSSVSDSDIAVEILELVLRSAVSDADPLELIAPVHESSILALTRRRYRRQIAHREIRVDAAIERLHAGIRVEVGLEPHVHRAVATSGERSQDH